MENHLNYQVVVIIEDMDRCSGAYKKLRRECRAWGCQFEVLHIIHHIPIEDSIISVIPEYPQEGSSGYLDFC
ncbi:hypothetical protein LXL04_005664 [Taraxacum kok-saghyz]